jgi:hypothetical protein
MALAPLAPEGFSIGLFAVGLFALCITLLLIGLRGAWIYTFGAIMERLSGVRINLPGRHDLHPLRFLHDYNIAVQNDITAKIHKSQAVSGYFFHGAAIIMAWTAREVAALGTDVLHWGQSLQLVKLPRLTRAMIIAAFPLPWLARRVAAIVAAHLPHIARLPRVKWRGLTRKQVAAMIAAAAGTLVTHLPGKTIIHRIRDVERVPSRLRKRIKRLEWLLSATGAVALVTTALGRLGLNWLRCRRVSRVGKAVCGMDSQLLGSILADATMIIGTISIVELTRGTQRLMPAITDATGYLVREAPQAWNDAPTDVIRDALAVFPDFPG